MISYFVASTKERIYDPSNSKYADHQIEAYGLSTDEKPIGLLRNADPFIEMDTCDIYLYDEQNRKYNLFCKKQ